MSTAHMLGFAAALAISLGARPAAAFNDLCPPLRNKSVLVLPGNSKHAARQATLANLQAMAEAGNFSLTIGDPLALTDAGLEQYDVIVFNYFFRTQVETNFPRASKDAFLRWLAKGNKGYVGYNTSGANEWATNEWREYQDEVTGMRFALHGAGTPIGKVEATTDPALAPYVQGLPATFLAADEWYEYQSDSKIFDPAYNWKILYYLTEVQAPSFPSPPNHPVTWIREDGKGTRYFYTTLISTQEGATSPFFKALLLRGLEYTAGASPCRPSTSMPSAKLQGLSWFPAERALRVGFPGSYRLSIWTLQGKPLLSMAGQGERTYRPFRQPGVYLVRLISAGQTHTQKILVP